MNAAEQRRLGVKLAVKADAPKTLAVIKDTTSSYEDILATAVCEIGAEKLASMLESEPEWAHYALLFVPDLGEGRDALVQASSAYKENIRQAAAARSGAESFAPAVTLVSSLELYEISGAAFECQFTMYWRDANGNIQPNFGTPDQSQWKWSQKLSIAINRSAVLDCGSFALPNSPLNKGDEVWMVVQIICGGLYDTNLRFVYDPAAGNARIDTWGASVAPNFGLHQGD